MKKIIASLAIVITASTFGVMQSSAAKGECKSDAEKYCGGTCR
jgi:hypothetical protein